MTKSRALHVSHATNVSPRTQRARERGLLAAANLGETHLHVSALAPGEVLALGAFHRRPAARGDVVIWPRHTGGRALPSGNGFVLTTLALPHRSALVGEDRCALAPDQVMNRCVRGVLQALRTLGVDVVYPGLDLLTVERRAIGALSFIEIGNAALFQAILAVGGTLADGPMLLDRADPDGVVPVTFIAPAEAATLAAILGADRSSWLRPSAFAERVASGYAEAFGIEIRSVDDKVTEVLADTYADQEELLEPPAPTGSSVRANGLLGPVEAWAEVHGGEIAGLSLAGDFISPADAPNRLLGALRGCPVDAAAIGARVTAFLDRDRGYFLGLRPADLIDLVHRSATVHS